MIFAAGRGERLRPLTDVTPKPLVEINGVPLIVRHLRRLRLAGFSEAVINVCYLGDAIRAALGDGGAWGMRLRYSSEEERLETAGGARLALARGLLADAPFVGVNADIVCDIDFARLRWHSGSWCHLVLVDNPPHHPHGDFSMDAQNHLLPPAEASLTYSGAGVFVPSLFADIAAGQRASLLPLLQKAIAHGAATAEKHNGLWHDTGTPTSLQAARQAVMAQETRAQNAKP